MRFVPVKFAFRILFQGRVEHPAEPKSVALPIRIPTIAGAQSEVMVIDCATRRRLMLALCALS